MQTSRLSPPNLNVFSSCPPSKPYQYDPLPSGPHIRCLTIHPGQGTDPLICTLHTASLTSLPSYEALSYVWGSSKKAVQISCDGRTIRITANLGDALRRARLPEKSRMLWADSICINQDDDAERGAQVALMGEIYRRATQTLIFLGCKATGRGRHVASLLADVNLRIKQQLADFGSLDHLPMLCKHDALTEDERWVHLTDMIRSPWFSRVWVVQEAAIAADARILYGEVEILWADLLMLHSWVVYKAQHIWVKYELYLNDSHHPHFWTQNAESPARLVGLLIRAKTLACKDARDRVYAFLGSVHASVGAQAGLIVEPDYRKTHLQVYNELARQFLSRTNDLVLLSAVEHTPGTLKSSFPSWVPRWDCIVANDQFGLHNCQFSAAKGMEEARISIPSSDRLKVHGFVVDSVHFRSKVLPGANIFLDLFTSCGFFPGPSTAVMQVIWWLPVLLLQYLVVTFFTFFLSRMKDPFAQIWKYVGNPATKSAYQNEKRLLAFVRTLCAGALGGNHSEFTPDEASFALELCKRSSAPKGPTLPALEEAAKGGERSTFRFSTAIWCRTRRFILTNHGYYGLAPYVVEEGDLCCIIRGLRVPIFLRKVVQKDHYRFIGESFVLGMMQGEAVQNAEKWGLHEQSFVLC